MAESSSRPTTNPVTTVQPPAPAPARVEDVGEDAVIGQFSAVINVHGCNLKQIEVALEANAHEIDPHPAQPGKFVRRHPVYLVCTDFSQTDESGHPREGRPLELDLKTIRDLYSRRYGHVAAEAPPADGSHVRVPGMHFIAELDAHGQSTGRLRLGSPEEVERS